MASTGEQSASVSVSHAVAHAVSCVLLKSSSSTTTFFSTTSNLLCHHLCPLGLDATDRCLPIGGSSSNGGDDSCCALTTNSHLRFNAVQSNGGMVCSHSFASLSLSVLCALALIRSFTHSVAHTARDVCMSSSFAFSSSPSRRRAATVSL